MGRLMEHEKALAGVVSSVPTTGSGNLTDHHIFGPTNSIEMEAFSPFVQSQCRIGKLKELFRF